MTDSEAPVGVLNLYAKPTDLKGRLGIADTSHDSVLWHLLHVASRVVDGHCGRNFYVSSESKRFDVSDRSAGACGRSDRGVADRGGLGRRWGV